MSTGNAVGAKRMRWLLLFTVLIPIAADTGSVVAQERRATGNSDEEAAKKGKTPPYPRVDVSPLYEVDAAWPQKSKDFQWAAMPGIAVDAKDQVDRKSTRLNSSHT